MAKKSRTRKSKSNDSQKKLLALVLIILFVGLGVFLVVSSFAAKGGKSKPGSGVTLVDSPYAIKATDTKFGGSTTISAVDKLTGALLNPQPESFSTSGACYLSGVAVGEWGKVMSNGEISIAMSEPTLSSGASCTAYLNIIRNGAIVPTAMTTFTVTP
jgi:hypothetical protein